MTIRASLLIAEVRYYRVTNRCQKKELLGRAQNGLRNPRNPLARTRNASKRSPLAVRAVKRKLALLAGEPAVSRSPAGAKQNPWASEWSTPVFM